MCRRCSNCIFIRDLTPGFNGFGNNNCKSVSVYVPNITKISKLFTCCSISLCFYLSLFAYHSGAYHTVTVANKLLPQFSYARTLQNLRHLRSTISYKPSVVFLLKILRIRKYVCNSSLMYLPVRQHMAKYIQNKFWWCRSNLHIYVRCNCILWLAV